MYKSLQILAVALVSICPARAQKDFPEAPAKEYVTKICLQCHEAAQLLSQKKTESDWKSTVARMAQKGVPHPPNSMTPSRPIWRNILPKKKTTQKSI